MKNIDEINRENLLSSTYFDASLSAGDTRAVLEIVASLLSELSGEFGVQRDDVLARAANETPARQSFYLGAASSIGRVVDTLDELAARLDPELA